MVAKTDPQLFGAMLDHGLTAAAAPPDLITSDARDLILRVSRGIPRLISHLLRISLVLADERGLGLNPASTATLDHADNATRHRAKSSNRVDVVL